MYDKDRHFIEKTHIFNQRSIFMKQSEIRERNTRKKTSPVKAILIVIFIILLLLGIVIGVYFYLRYQEEQDMKQQLDIDTFYQGITIQGIDMGGKTKEEAKVLLTEIEPSLRNPIDITLTYQEHSYHYTQDHFDFTYDTDKVIEQALSYGRDGDIRERYATVMALQHNPQNYEITSSLVSDNKPAQYIAQIADELYTAPVNPVTKFDPNAVPMFFSTQGINGFEINQQQALDAFSKLLTESGQGTIELTTIEIPFSNETDDLATRTQLLSSFTTVSTNNANGNHNMQLALQKVNGTVLQPGEIFSYNTTIGNSTSAAGGWLAAAALKNGKTVQEYGGGICQASTTLYGAVLRADLKVVTRYNHRWPSTYVPIGQDATVDYPGLDFQFQNNYDTEIFIQSYMTGTTLVVNIYGKPSSEWDKIEVVSQKTETIAAPETIYEQDAELPTGTEVVDVTSRAGSKAAGSKIYYKNGVEVKREAIASSYYKPVQGVIKVGIG